MLTLVTQSLYLEFSIWYMVNTMFTADFMPKDDKKVCENCLFFEECPMYFVCPTLDRIYTKELLDKMMDEEE